ncbi:zinc finger CCCH-type with G patch domain-containing protein [Erpetoichthys calabaricus]|uniref:Zinc finger CCCH-type with G patch domain-containing protein n=1 Tax=Erpetoichthys calabaricus TaxID=27687 RepID=A0A8C4S1T3_ERPCA|nr:zinc finger CCCH-type with G patch domain-containing protein [Erpetoichthys calabaricus]
MDEESLTSAIKTYNIQLRQVEAALSAGLDPSQETDLLKLKDDLRQLIELTEASLISLKKSNLLASLEASNTQLPFREADEAQSSIDDKYAAFYASIEEPHHSESSKLQPLGDQNEPSDHNCSDLGISDDDDDSEAMSGMKVQAPYRTTWGTLEYHNAMVVGAEYSEDTEPKVRVLYVYPTHKSMKPCPFFLDDKCRFMEKCRFSHGEVVAVSELRNFQESDLSSLEVGSSCLVRHEDGIWYPASIKDIDSGYYTVKFDSLLLKEAVVEADCIIPPLRKEDSSSEESEDEEIGDDSAYAKVIDSASAVTNEWTSSCGLGFGGWEAHTRGIGSKLMVKMGYEFGKGLGRNAEGRVEPIQAVVLPKGKSLDQCAEILQKKKEGKIGKGKAKKLRKNKQNGTGSSMQQKNRQTVFDFLNDTLKGKKHGSALEAENPAAPRTSKEIYRGEQSIKRTLNVRLFQAAEKVEQTQKEIHRLQEALARNIGRDKGMTSLLEEKLNVAKKQLEQMKAQEVIIQREQRKANTHKKMTEF